MSGQKRELELKQYAEEIRQIDSADFSLYLLDLLLSGSL